MFITPYVGVRQRPAYKKQVRSGQLRFIGITEVSSIET